MPLVLIALFAALAAMAMLYLMGYEVHVHGRKVDLDKEVFSIKEKR